jgi:hypothetical protein
MYFENSWLEEGKEKKLGRGSAGSLKLVRFAIPHLGTRTLDLSCSQLALLLK